MATHTLRIWLSAPMQSWGSSSRFDVRTTNRVPTKSGVIGLVCAALGRSRHESVDDLASLRFGVRVERPGTVMRDFHTAGAGTDPIAVASGARSEARGTTSERYYLADAAFVAGLEVDEDQLELLQRVNDALASPQWLLSLGRRSCPPVPPLVDSASLIDKNLEEALKDTWWPGFPNIPVVPSTARRKSSRDESLHESVELRVECDPSAEEGVGGVFYEQSDQPVGAAFKHGGRTFAGTRMVVLFVPRGEAR